jgi:hypothetical protein
MIMICSCLFPLPKARAIPPDRGVSSPTVGALASAPLARRESHANAPTTFCLIGEKLLAHTLPADFTVTLADAEGMTVRPALQAKDLSACERFLAAVLQETGYRFQYLPWGNHCRDASRSQPIAP